MLVVNQLMVFSIVLVITAVALHWLTSIQQILAVLGTLSVATVMAMSPTSGRARREG